MADVRLYRRGQIFWVDAFPVLDGGQPKRRPVVLVIVPPAVADPAIAVVVAVSTTPGDVSANDFDKVPLPSSATHRQSTSGLTRPCWALPRWVGRVRVEKLGHCSGYVSGRTLDRIVLAVQTRLQAQLKNRPPEP